MGKFIFDLQVVIICGKSQLVRNQHTVAHIYRCKCKAEFCYMCGLRWHTCSCGDWEDEHLNARANEVVEREAAIPLVGRALERRFYQVREELQNNHECGHSRHFERIFNSSRRGLRCDLCDARHWKYILRCRYCHLDVCEECRKNRI